MAFHITTQHDDTYEPTFPTLEPGFYHAVVFEYTETQTNKPNKETSRPDDMIVLNIGIYEKPEDESKHTHIAEVKFYLVMSPKQQWRIERAVKACGHKFGQGARLTIDANTFVGARIAVRTSLKPGQKGGMFIQIDALLARDKVPHLGAFTEAERAQYNIDVQGVRDGNNVTRQTRQASTPAATSAPAPASDEAEEEFQW